MHSNAPGGSNAGGRFDGREQRVVNRVLNGQANQHVTSITIDGGEVETLQANRTGELSEIADIRVPKDHIYVFPPDRPLQMFIPVHEQFTTNATAGDSETFSLSHDLADSAWARQSEAGSGNGEVTTTGRENLILYDNGTQVEPNAVDFTNNTFDYEDADTGSTLDVYYLWRDAAEIHVRSRQANLQGYEQRLGHTAAGFHVPNVYSKDQIVPWKNSFALDEKERLEILIDTAVDLTNWDAINDDGPNNTDSYAYFQLPCYKLNKSQDL